MATLTDDVKVFIVQALACFDSPATVAAAVKDQYGITVSRQQVESYDHTKACAKGVAKRLVALFDETRAAFLRDAATVPVAKQVYRLRVLQRTLDRAEKQGNSVLVLDVLERAAKEMGGAFTNRREVTGKDGGPIQQTSVSAEDLAAAVRSVRSDY